MAQPAVERLLSVEEFFALPDPEDGSIMELMDGRLVVAPPPGERHGFLLIELGASLRAFVRDHELGRVVGGSGFVLRREGDRPIAVAPDVAFMSAAAIGSIEASPAAREGAPDLAVEVVSPSDRRAYVNRKVDAYLDAGTTRVWLVWPDRREVIVHRPDAPPLVLGLEDVLTSEDAGFAAQGFALPLRDLFAG